MINNNISCSQNSCPRQDIKNFASFIPINISECFQRNFIIFTWLITNLKGTHLLMLRIYVYTRMSVYKWASNLYLRFYNFIDFSALSGKAPWTADGFPRQCLNIYGKFYWLVVVNLLCVLVSRFAWPFVATPAGFPFHLFLGSNGNFRLAQLAGEEFIFYAASTAVNYDGPCVFPGSGEGSIV